MVNTTYVRVGVPTHRADLCHHGLRIGERSPKSTMERPQGEERRKKERPEERERWAGALFCTEVMSVWLVRVLYKSCHMIRRDWIDVAQSPPVWRPGQAPPPSSRASAYVATPL
jgi:hypothetical protein